MLMWYTTMIDLCMSNPVCILGMNATFSSCVILLNSCWILFVNILLTIFTSMFIRYTCLCFFFFFNLCLVLLLGKDGLVKWVWKCSFLISCFGKNNWRRMNINSFFNVWQNSLWSHLDLDFCLRRVLWLLVQVCY